MITENDIDMTKVNKSFIISLIKIINGESLEVKCTKKDRESLERLLIMKFNKIIKKNTMKNEQEQTPNEQEQTPVEEVTAPTEMDLLKEFQEGIQALAIKTGYGLDIEHKIVIKKINVENTSENN